MKEEREKRFLINAIPRTGQHWFLYIIANYNDIIKKGAMKPVPWELLHTFGRAHYLETPLGEIINRGYMKDDEFVKAYPKIFRSEYIYNENQKVQHLHESFDKMIYLL